MEVFIISVVKNLMVRAGADFSGLTSATKKAQQTLKSFQDNIGSTMSKIKATLAAIGIGKLVKDATSVAMTNETSIQQINRTMSVHSKEFLQWANTQALAYGMAKAEATKYGAVYSNLISGFEGDTSRVTQYTQKLLESSAVVASGTGRTMEDTMDRIRSGLLGNTESIEDLGINVNVAMIESTNAFKKFAGNKSWQQLNFQTQQQIRLFAIMEQASKKYGDSINQNTASDQQKFVAQLKNAQLALGQAFLPIYQTILPALTSLAAKLAYVMNIVAQFSQALFGKKQETQTKTTEQQASAVSSVGDAYKDAGKKAKGALAGFDEINSLADGSGGAGLEDAALNATSGATGPMSMDFSTNAPDISAKVQDMVNKVKTIIADLSTFMTQNKDIIVSAIAGIGAGFAAFQIISNWTAIITGLKAAFMGVAAVVGGISLPILAIAAAIAAVVGGFIYFYKTNETFRGVVDGILNSIKDAAIYLWQNVLVPLGKFIADVFVAAWDKLSVAGEWLCKNVLTPIGSILKDYLAIAFQTVADIAMSFWQNVLVPLGDFFSSIFGPTIEALSAVFTYLWENILSPLATFITDVLKVAFTALIIELQFLWNNVLKPLTEFLSGTFKIVFDNVFKAIGDIIGGLKTTIIGLMNFITGVFTGDWQKAWKGIQDIFKGIWDSFVGIVKAPINLIIDMVNFLISGLNKISIKIPDWVPEFGGKSFGVNIAALPHLKSGGITNGEMAAVIGDNPGGHEVVSPLEDLMDMIQSAVGTSIMSALQFSNSNSKQGDVILQIDGTTLARVLDPYSKNESSRIGGTMITAT